LSGALEKEASKEEQAPEEEEAPEEVPKVFVPPKLLTLLAAEKIGMFLVWG